MPRPFRVLTVCTGNICRSPAAQRLLAVGLRPEVSVASAGLRAVVGAPVDPSMLDLLAKDGLSFNKFEAKQFTEDLPDRADLVLTMTRKHRTDLVMDAPSAINHTFTLLEFARIATSPDLPPLPQGGVGVRMRALTELAARHRLLGAGPGEFDDVPDPYRKGAKVFQESYGLIRDAVGDIVQVVRASG